MPLLRSIAAALLLFFLPGGAPLSAAQAGARSPNSAAPAAAPARVQRLTLPGIRNAGQAGDFLYRGAQPQPAGYAQLRQLGIAIVVDLHNRGQQQQRERLAVESNGMRYLSLPASPTAGPSDEQIAAFLLLLRENSGRKIFVHCKRGADRTGVMIAAFRMAEEHWTPRQARAEMRAFHFHRIWLPAMRHRVRDFPKNYANNPVFAPLRQPGGPPPGQSPAGPVSSPPRSP